MEPFEAAGLWWLPDSLDPHELPPDTAVVGLLKYSPDTGFKLSIPFGTIEGEDGFHARMNDRSTPIPVIRGYLRNDRRVTLLDCLSTSMSLSVPGGACEDLQTHLGFVGNVYCTANPWIDSVRVSYRHLRDWVVKNPCTQEYRIVGKKLQLDKPIQYAYNNIDDHEIAVSDGWQILVSHIGKISPPTVKGFNVEHDCELKIIFSHPLDFETVATDFLDPIWQFLSFCLNRCTTEMYLLIQLAGQNEWLDTGQALYMSPSKDETVNKVTMLLSMPRLEKVLGDVLPRWLNLDGDERRAVSLLVNLSDDSSISFDLLFLTAVQALEALARVVIDPLELNPAEYKRRKDIVLASISDKKIRDWAARKLKHANDKHLSVLFRTLFSLIGPYIDELAPDQKIFLRDIIDNRNFYTHRDDSRAKNVLEGSKLYTLTQGVINLLKATVLRTIFGFSEHETKTIMDDCVSTNRWRKSVAGQYP